MGQSSERRLPPEAAASVSLDPEPVAKVGELRWQKTEESEGQALTRHLADHEFLPANHDGAARWRGRNEISTSTRPDLSNVDGIVLRENERILDIGDGAGEDFATWSRQSELRQHEMAMASRSPSKQVLSSRGGGGGVSGPGGPPGSVLVVLLGKGQDGRYATKSGPI